MCANHEIQNTSVLELEQNRSERTTLMDDLESSHQKIISFVDRITTKKMSSKDKKQLNEEKSELLDEIKKKNANY